MEIESTTLVCPVCETKTVYTRLDGTKRCYRCNWDTRKREGNNEP